MLELKKEELWFIRMAFSRSPRATVDLSCLRRDMLKHRFMEVDEVIDALLAKDVLSRSPDGRQVRMTDLGIESFRAAGRSQAAWMSEGPPAAMAEERGVVLISAGDAFAADRLIRAVLRRASKDLAVIDAYVGTSLFDHLDDLPTLPDVRILTSDAITPATRRTYAAFRQKHDRVEMRTARPGVLHDRFVLWDELAGAAFGHSLKDLGRKDTQVTWLADATEHWKLFDTRWGTADPVL